MATAFTYGDPKKLGPNLAYDPATFYFSAGIKISPNTQPPNWGVFNLPNGILNVAYQAQWNLTNCATPVTFTLQSGSLPTGLTLSSLGGGEGQLSGTPTAVGTFNFTLTATNSVGTANQAFTVTISAVASGGAFAFVG